jgi:putative ATP-binding cassette transporter
MKNNKLTLRGLLFSSASTLLVIAIILGMVSGALYALIIPTILAVLGGQEIVIQGFMVSNYLHIIFFSLITLVLVSKASSVILVNNIAKTAVAKLRIDISKKINAMDIGQVESIGFSRLFNIMTEDLNRITFSSIAIPKILVDVVTVIGMLVYLAILDMKIFLFTIAGIAVGLVLFQLPMIKAKKLYTISREEKDVIQEGVKGLIFGSYELKLSREKSKKYIAEEIAKPVNKSLGLEKKGDFILHLAGNASEILCFFAIGVVVFSFDAGADNHLYGVVMALLYITGPIASILVLMQDLKMGEISLYRVNEIKQVAVTTPSDSKVLDTDWNTLKLNNLEYSYATDSGAFSVGEINLELHRGGVYFIVGGNGSGKSTLSKVISMHYMPQKGQVYFDDTQVTDELLAQAREKVFVIYSNYYLFNRVYKELNEADLALIDHYLKLFALDHKTKIENNTFSTVKLSDGQRRRLALIIAIVEDRDIYILDEWAADQDPEFKDLYYKFVLPELKAKGKTVLVITHDDRYFAACDQLIKMEDGKIVSVTNYDNNNMAAVV